MDKIDCVVLIDDDEATNVFHDIIIRESAIINNYTIFNSAIKALAFLTDCDKSPDLIFLDINMPKMSGWEFLEEYGKTSLTQTPHVIMLTTSMSVADKAKANDNPLVRSYFQKPLSEELLHKLAMSLG